MILSILLYVLTSISSADVVNLDTNNTVLLKVEIDDDSVAYVQKEIQRLVDKRGSKSYNIYLVLDSPGGSLESGNMLIEFLKTIPNLNTITVFAASMASAVVQALPGERLILESGTMMFHRARAQISGQIETGELESRLMWIKHLVRQLERTNAQRIGITLKEYKEKVKDEWWVNGSDNVSQKTADKVVSVKCSSELFNSKIDLELNLGIFTVPVRVSKCPIAMGIEIKQ